MNKKRGVLLVIALAMAILFVANAVQAGTLGYLLCSIGVALAFLVGALIVYRISA